RDVRGEERGRRPHARRARLPAPRAVALPDRLLRPRPARGEPVRLLALAVIFASANAASAGCLVGWRVTATVCTDGEACAADGHRDRARLGLVCRRRAGARAPRAVVVTTDFETGLLATVGVNPPHPVEHPATPIHSDAVVRVAGDRVYVVNRFLGDNLQVLDP